MKQFGITGLIIISIIGCGDRPDVSNSRSFIGVHGLLSPKLKNQELFLSRAVNLDQYDEYSPDTISTLLSGASVTVEYNDQEIIFAEISPGYYVDTASALQLIPGETYTLNVKSAENERVTAATTVPGIPELLPNSLIDTMRVIFEIDTASCATGCILNLNAPVLTLAWKASTFAGSYFFKIGKDSARFFDTENGFRILPKFTLLNSIWNTKNTNLKLFETGDLYSNDYEWHPYFTDRENVLEMDVEIQISSFDFGLTDWVSQEGSNVKGGYGFFGSMSFYHRPLFVIQTTKYVN
jgi:hypothetical protein